MGETGLRGLPLDLPHCPVTGRATLNPEMEPGYETVFYGAFDANIGLGYRLVAQRHQPAAIIKVKVHPRASSNQLVGYRAEVLHLSVTAPPAEGLANAAVVSLLAGVLDVAKSRVRVMRGHGSRDKVVAVESLTVEEVRHRVSVSGGVGPGPRRQV